MKAKILLLLGVLLVAGLSVKAQTVSKTTNLIVPCQQVGPITATSTEAQLIQSLGAKNVKRGDVYIAEGYSEPGTIVYPDDPARRIEILWKDTKNYKKPHDITLREAGSIWQTAEGIQLGTPLKTMNALNGKPFKINGFGWDYGGWVSSWNGGKLAKAFTRGQRSCISVRFDTATDGYQGLTEVEASEISGDIEVMTDSPALQKVNPIVVALNLNF